MRPDGAQFYVRFDVARRGHQVYRVVNGSFDRDIGPLWPTPRQAIDYANRLTGLPQASPLRTPMERYTTQP